MTMPTSEQRVSRCLSDQNMPPVNQESDTLLCPGGAKKAKIRALRPQLLKLAKVVPCAVAGLVACFQIPALAVDELRLCGNVTEVDREKTFVMINVISESCRGARKFLVDDRELASFQVDEVKCFIIDSNICKTNYVYTITKIEKE